MTGFASPNYTQCPNDLFDVLMCQMGDAELRVVLAVVRLTTGYHRDHARASLTAIAGMTGLSRQGVLDGAATAEQRGLLSRSHRAQPGARGNVTQWTINILDQPRRTSTRPRPRRPPALAESAGRAPSPRRGEGGVRGDAASASSTSQRREPSSQRSPVNAVDQPEPPLVKPVDQAEPPLVKPVDQTGQASRPPSIKESIKKESSPLARRAPVKHRQTYSPAVEDAWARRAPINHVQRAAINAVVVDVSPSQRSVDAWRLAGDKPTDLCSVLNWYAHGGPPSRAAPLRSTRCARDAPDHPLSDPVVRSALCTLGKGGRRLFCGPVKPCHTPHSPLPTARSSLVNTNFVSFDLKIARNSVSAALDKM